MAKDVRALSRGQEDDYEDILETGEEGTGPGDEGTEGDDRQEDGSDAAFDAGEEQEIGGEADLEELPRPSRGENRFQRLSNELRGTRQALDEIRRQQRTQEQPRQQQWPQEETDEQFNARTTLLPLEDRIAERQARSERRNAAQVNFLMLEHLDKSSFDAKCLTSPSRRRMAAQVEEEQQKLLRERAQWNSRESVWYYLRGKLLAEREETGSSRTPRRQQAQERVQRQTTQPLRGGSDVARGSRRQLTEREARVKRLEGQRI
jgi:hypothetical protein